MRTSLTALALVVACSLAGCSTEEDMRAVDPGASETPASAASDAGDAPRPVPEGRVRTPGLVTVLDDGDGPELCLGAIAESYPPQCGGPPIEGWEWGDVGVERASGVTWGSFAVTGTFDGTTFTVTDAIPAALYDTVADDPRDDTPGAACDDPGGTDAGRSTPEDLDATLTAASALPGYASAWMTGDTVNIAVTADAEGAERALRETWGGPLCVTVVEQTDADLVAINTELQEALGDRLLTSGSYTPDSLDAQVLWDDGSVQAWADETWGEGLVRVSSALVPAG